MFVLNVVDGCLPSDLGTGTTAELEEERRLLYVAMTRAKDELDLIVPRRFYAHQQAANGDRQMCASRTRFLPHSSLSLFEMRSWPLLRAEVNGTHAPSRAASLDVGARMRAMWRCSARISLGVRWLHGVMSSPAASSGRETTP